MNEFSFFGGSMGFAVIECMKGGGGQGAGETISGRSR